MVNIISIETAAQLCSVALHTNGQLAAHCQHNNPKSHSATIIPFLQNVAQQAQLSLHQIHAVAVGKGPGSYTGLRIGVSAAKGLCYGLGIPLIAINTLEGMVQHPALIDYVNEDILFCPMIDARRMEVYCALYTPQGENIQETQALILTENLFLPQLKNTKIVFFGSGAAKCKEVLAHPNAIFVDDVHPSAAYMGALAMQQYNKQAFEDVAYFEPYYLKEFMTTTPKV